MQEEAATWDRLARRANELNKTEAGYAKEAIGVLKNLRPIGELPADKKEKARLVPILLSQWKQMEDLLKEQSGINAIATRNRGLNNKRELGELFQEIFFRAQDSTAAATKYHSKFNYTITMPKGWTPVSDDLIQLMQLNVMMAPKGADLYFIKTGFIGDGRTSFDLLRTTMFDYPRSGPITDEELSQMRNSVLNSNQAFSQNIRSYSLKAAKIGAWDGAIAQGVFGSKERPSNYQQVLILIPPRLLTVACYTGEGVDLSECNTIIKSIELE